jgi:hypothetical protein
MPPGEQEGERERREEKREDENGERGEVENSGREGRENGAGYNIFLVKSRSDLCTLHSNTNWEWSKVERVGWLQARTFHQCVATNKRDRDRQLVKI